MSKLISDYCEAIANEPVTKFSASFDLTREENDQLESFKIYVAQSIKEKAGLEKEPKITNNDLCHKLLFAGIRSDRSFMRNLKKYRPEGEKKRSLEGATTAESKKTRGGDDAVSIES